VRGTAASTLSSLTTELDIKIPVQLLPPLSRTESGLRPPSIATTMKQSTDSLFQQSSASCVLQSPSLLGLSTPKETGAQHSSERLTAGRNMYMALLLSPQAVVNPHHWTSVLSISLLHPCYREVG